VIPALREREKRGPQIPRTAENRHDDGHGFFYVDFSSLTVVRDTDLGKNYTAAAILQRTGVGHELRRLLERGKLQIRRPADKIALHSGHPDTAETRQALLRQSPQHDDIVDRHLAREQELHLSQRRGLRR
ncbi:MAG TPA: hypothetical protein VKU83_10280, partial [Puia sp.]|nr:hypothetical protein [Puia sp.]